MTNQKLQISNLGDLGTGIRLRPMEAVDRALDNLVGCVKSLVREAKWTTDLAKETRRMIAEFVEGDRPEEATAKIKDMAIFHCLSHLPVKHWQVWFIKTCMELEVPHWAEIYKEDIDKASPPTRTRTNEVSRDLFDIVCGEDQLAAERLFVIDIIHSPDIEWKIEDRVRILKSIAEDYKLKPPSTVESEPLYGELMGYNTLGPGTYVSGKKSVFVDGDGHIRTNEEMGDVSIFSYSGPPTPIGKILK
jgi:hypothetical protein